MKEKKLWLLLIVLLIIVLGCGHFKNYQELQREVVNLSESVACLQAELEEIKEKEMRDAAIVEPLVTEEIKKIYQLPELIVFCNDTLRIAENFYIKQRIEREFFIFLQDWGQAVIWIKRSGLFFPFIEEEIAKRGLPDDLKYVPVVESSLSTKARSPKEAWGLWQFIESTGKRYHLPINNNIDQRLDFRRATCSALNYLSDLSGEFKGDWYLALAAYNIGSGGVINRINSQGTRNYFELHLPEETARFVCRIIAVKIIFENYAIYGLDEWVDDLYSFKEIKAVTISINSSLPVKKIYQTLQFSPWEFHYLNPQILQNNLTAGQHCLYLPLDKYELFKDDLKKLKGVKINND